MKPLHISVRNLGAIPSADVDLTGINLAAICGANGLGKSTMFTVAPRFALFGNLKPGTRVDDMVRTGASEMSVVFDFEHQGDVWRVIRTRSTKGKGKSTLELQRQTGELWASESGSSIDETQKKIVSLLNLTDETFTASSMILQGDAANFTARPAGQRKAILGQVLQIEQYEDLQERARAKANILTLSLERDKAAMAAIDARIADRSGIENDLINANLLLADTVEEEKKTDYELNFARKELEKLVLRQQQADGIMKQISTLRGGLARKLQDRTGQQERFDKAGAFLSEEQGILTAAADYDRIRDQVTALQTKDEQRISLTKAGCDVAAELDQVGKSLNKVWSDIADAETLLAARPELEAAAEQLDDAKNALLAQNVAKEAFEDHSQRLKDIETEIRAKTNLMSIKSAAMVKEIRTFEGRSAMLSDAGCVDIENAACKFLADAKHAAAKVKTMQAEYDAWHDEELLSIHNLTGQRDGILMSRSVIGYDPAAHAAAKERHEGIVAKTVQLKSLEGTLRLLTHLQAQQTELETRNASLTERRQQLRESYRKLQDELASLPALTDQMGKLEKYVQQRELLPAIREQQESAQEQIEALADEIDSLKQRIDELEQQYFDTIPEDGLISGWNDALAERQRELEQIRRDNSAAILRIGSLQAKLEALDKDAVEHAAILERMAPAARELDRWWTLVKAFGRDGIPALIIENAVPELERIANDILGQMSAGKHSLRFETQRELKSRSGMAETLDIIVGDWAGERIYETFSGGEQLRIDFAIRFALAELLARRAGSKIEWLTIDEGWGSQSDEYLPLVIDAVKNIAGRFGMVLVISHIKQVQEAFEQQITFRPNGEAVDLRVA